MQPLEPCSYLPDWFAQMASMSGFEHRLSLYVHCASQRTTLLAHCAHAFPKSFVAQGAVFHITTAQMQLAARRLTGGAVWARNQFALRTERDALEGLVLREVTLDFLGIFKRQNQCQVQPAPVIPHVKVGQFLETEPMAKQGLLPACYSML